MIDYFRLPKIEERKKPKPKPIVVINDPNRLNIDAPSPTRSNASSAHSAVKKRRLKDAFVEPNLKIAMKKNCESSSESDGGDGTDSDPWLSKSDYLE